MRIGSLASVCAVIWILIGTVVSSKDVAPAPASSSAWAEDFTMDMNVSDAALASFEGEDGNDQVGWAVAIVGDVNGDGYDDMMIGAPSDEEGGNGAGQVYLIFGRPSGWMTDISIGTADASFVGEDADDNAGHEVSAAGDVNGDGYDDILIGAVGDEDGGGGQAGQTYLILGKESGWMMDTDLSNADASFIGENGGDLSGKWISAVGDVNADGFDDFVISARGYSGNTGQIYLVLGKATGWAMDTGLASSAASFIGEGGGTWTGTSVAGAGDVNDDGYDDILIGSSDIDGGKGKTYVIFGKQTGWAMDTNIGNVDGSFNGEAGGDYSGIYVAGPGDLNGDGIDDIITDASNNDESGNNFGQVYVVFGKSIGWSMNKPLVSNAAASYLGDCAGSWEGREIWGAGDLNGDGYNDFIVGDSYNNERYAGAGQAFVIFGKESGWAMDTPLNASDLSFIGESANDKLGYSVSGQGDVNGDGNDDILIGATGHSEGGMGAGKAYLISVEGFQEPVSVTSVKARDTNGDLATKADIGQNIEIEMTGVDRNVTHIDKARVNITFSQSKPEKITVSLRETGMSTGIYRGIYRVRQNAIYFENMRLSAYVDPTKRCDVKVDYPFRPTTINTIGIYSTETSMTTVDKLDLDQKGFFRIDALDVSPLTLDKAFLRLTSDKNSSFDQMIIMRETDISSGVFLANFTIPRTMQYFENITVQSLDDITKSTRFMVHTPIQIRYTGALLNAEEDSEYKVVFRNFGYMPGEWAMTSEADWLSWDGPTMSLVGTPDNSHVGKWSVMVTLEDSLGNRDKVDYTLKVSNIDPSILTEDVEDAKEGEDYSVDYDSDDDGQGIIDWFLDTTAQWLSIDKSSGVLSGTPENDEVGEVMVRISVRDGNGGMGFSLFNLTVENTNQKPEITTEDIFSVSQDVPYRRDYDLSDPDTGDSHLWSLTTQAQWLRIDNATGVLNGTPKATDVGIHHLVVTVTDQGGLSDRHEFDLTVIDVKDKPFWIDVPTEVVEVRSGVEFRFDMNASDYDVGTIITYSVSTDPETDLRINPNTGVILWTVSKGSLPVGTDTVTVSVKASDGELFVPYVFSIKITSTGLPTSTLTSPLDRSRTHSGYSLLQWSGSDPEGERIVYDVYISNSEVDLLGKNLASRAVEKHEETTYNATGLVSGLTYYWTVIPYDGGSYGTCNDGIRSFTVNHAPRIAPLSNVKATTGALFKLKITATDADDGDDLKFTLTRYPEGMDIDEDSGVIEWTPNADQTGDRAVTVQVTDGIEPATYSFNIDVRQGEKGSSTSTFITIGAIALLFVLSIGIVLFIVIWKKGPRPEEQSENVEDESARIAAEMERHKQEMDGTAPKSGEALAIVAASPAEANANLGKDRPKSYQEMYGTPAPKEEEALTTEDLKEEIGKMADQLENEA